MEKEKLDALLKTPYKEYVAAIEERDVDGKITPRVIIREDGERYEIVKVIASCKAAATKAGGTGLRFTIRVEGTSKPTFLWLEDDCKGGGRYFVELRRPKSA